MNMIEVENLTKKFGENTAVDSLTFQVAQGEVFGLLGPNGAGKTTTIRMLCCLISNTSGDARIAGYRIGNGADSLTIRKLIGLVPDNIGLYEELSAYENLDYYGKLYECTEANRKEQIEYFLKMLDLWEKRDQPISDFSKGMKQKVAIARALIHDPELLFFDEPTANLDPESARVVRDFILKLKKDGKTIFLNTHNLDEAQRICDRIGILKTKLLTVNTPEQLEKTVWGSKTVIQMEQINDQILAAVQKLEPKALNVEENRFTLTLGDPQKENPDFIQAIVSAGGRIQYVTQLNPGLEETYLKVIEETK
ncbi:MAG: ABC transporter ATP-binding protein [Anaerolineales bacterium]|jgi:ABC-2 type transport system ATP-binding protein